MTITMSAFGPNRCWKRLLRNENQTFLCSGATEYRTLSACVLQRAGERHAIEVLQCNQGRPARGVSKRWRRHSQSLGEKRSLRESGWNRPRRDQLPANVADRQYGEGGVPAPE